MYGAKSKKIRVANTSKLFQEKCKERFDYFSSWSLFRDSLIYRSHVIIDIVWVVMAKISPNQPYHEIWS